MCGTYKRCAARHTPALSAPEFARLLGRGEPAGLGAVRLVDPWGRTVQWLPADDGIVALDGRLDTHDDPGPVRTGFHVATAVAQDSAGIGGRGRGSVR